MVKRNDMLDLRMIVNEHLERNREYYSQFKAEFLYIRISIFTLDDIYAYITRGTDTQWEVVFFIERDELDRYKSIIDESGLTALVI